MAPIPDDDSTLLYTERISQFVSLPPAALATPLPALCASVLSPLLLSYFPPAHGVVLAYEDVSLSSSPPSPDNPHAQPPPHEPVLLRHVDEYTSPFLWVTATFLVWRPQRNKFISARVSLQSKTHLTLSYLNLFPVSVLATQLPPSWRFVSREAAATNGRMADGGGVWVDGDGEAVGGDVRVRVLDFDARVDGKAKGKGLRLEGSLLSESEEKRGEKGKGKAKRGILKTQASQEVE